MTELTDLRRARANLAFFVDDRAVILARGRVQPECGPTILQRKHRTEMVGNESGPELRLKWIDVQLRVAVQEPVRGVAAVLVHGSDHQQPEVLAHAARFACVDSVANA